MLTSDTNSMTTTHRNVVALNDHDHRIVMRSIKWLEMIIRRWHISVKSTRVHRKSAKMITEKWNVNRQRWCYWNSGLLAAAIQAVPVTQMAVAMMWKIETWRRVWEWYVFKVARGNECWCVFWRLTVVLLFGIEWFTYGRTNGLPWFCSRTTGSVCDACHCRTHWSQLHTEQQRYKRLIK